MARDQVFYGPTPFRAAGPLSSSSSPRSSALSSESPRTASSFTFSVISFGDDRRDADGEDVVAKVEEVDEDDLPLDVKFHASSIEDAAAPVSPEAPVARRPRGRPRKHPRTLPTVLSKPPKGRSKTGCVTCRRRKKKCDERKPTCKHCEKNNVQCEGYPPREVWLSGRQRLVVKNNPSPHLPHLIQGLENEVDWRFFHHFNMRLSTVLTLYREQKNPFQEVLLPMALIHQGLMHSLLSLSASHLLNTETDPSESLTERAEHHFVRAMGSLRENPSFIGRLANEGSTPLEETVVAQAVFLCLRTICDGNTSGHYRFHLDAIEHMLKGHVVKNEHFSGFLYDFLIYHDMSSSITSERPSMMSDDFVLPSFINPEAGVFLGVCDGLFGCISKVRRLRDRIRLRRATGEIPHVDFHTILDAKAIDAELNQRECNYDLDTPEWTCWQLYRSCAWLYLHRTINPSIPNEQLRLGVDEAVGYLQSIPSDSGTQSVILTPIFIVGCSAFHEHQRQAVLQAFDVLQQYSALGNIKPAREVVEKVWQFMDAGDDCTWDWESIMKRMGYDLLIT